ncbi:MAG: F0F1 ATP synthase subunit A [Terracidiphilus sp.]|jgi:F-type H+-transporting ATPase subunit a
MTAPLGITRFLNAAFGGVVASAMHAMGLKADPATVIGNTFAVELIIAGGLIAFFLVVRLTLSVEKPGPAQQIAELIHNFVGGQAESVIGHGYERFQAFITCVGLFIVLNNLAGLIPGVQAPTSVPFVPLGVALLAFIYYNYHGLRVNGFVGYLKQFAGPVWWLIPLLFPIEIVSHLARVMSLTIRLYANMFAGDQVTLVFFSLFPVALPAVFMGMHFFVSLIQAFVFMLLTTIYLSLAVSHDH